MATMFSQSLNNMKILAREILVNKKDIHVEFRGAAEIQLCLGILQAVTVSKRLYAA